MAGFQQSQQTQQQTQQAQKTQQQTQQAQKTQQTPSPKAKSDPKKDYADMSSVELRDEINRLKRSYDGLKKSIDGLEAMEGSVVSTADLRRQSDELISKMNELTKLHNQKKVEEERQAAAAKKVAETTVSAGGGKYVFNVYIGDGITPRTDCNAQS